MGRALVAGEDQVVRQRQEQERDRQARQHHLAGPLLGQPAEQAEHDQRGDESTGERRRRQRPEPEHVAGDRDHHHRARRRAGRQPEQERVGQVVAGQGLKHGPDHSETGADDHRQQRTRQPQIEHDPADRVVAGTGQHHFDDPSDAELGRADRHRDQQQPEHPYQAKREDAGKAHCGVAGGVS